MPDLWTDLLGCLDLHIEDGERSGTHNVTVFEGASQQLKYHRVFGGQLLGQFIRAASLTAPTKRSNRCMRCSREGHLNEPVRYLVTRQHEGRSFATLTITAHQTRGVLASSSVCMHTVEDGPEHQDCQAVPTLSDERHRVELDLIPWETRSTDDLNAVTASPPRFQVWMRTPPVDSDLAPALAAYATDLTLIGTALRPLEGFNHSGNGTLFTSAVTSHTVWFHRPFRTDRWLLLRQHSPALAHGRCFGRGDVLTEGGALVASYAQEALLRFRDAAESVDT